MRKIPKTTSSRIRHRCISSSWLHRSSSYITDSDLVIVAGYFDHFYYLQTLSINFISYVDKTTLMVAVDEKAIPDPQLLCDDVEAALKAAVTACSMCHWFCWARLWDTLCFMLWLSSLESRLQKISMRWINNYKKFLLMRINYKRIINITILVQWYRRYNN